MGNIPQEDGGNSSGEEDIQKVTTDMKRRSKDESEQDIFGNKSEEDIDDFVVEDDGAANLQRHFVNNQVPTLENGSCKDLNSQRSTTSLNLDGCNSDINERRNDSFTIQLEKDEEEALVAEEVLSEDFCSRQREQDQKMVIRN